MMSAYQLHPYSVYKELELPLDANLSLFYFNLLKFVF